MTGNASKFWGVALSAGLTAMGLFFLFGVMEEGRNAKGPEAVFAAVAAGAIFYAIFRGPIGRAIGKMLEGASVADEQIHERIDQIEDRVAGLGTDQQRIAELEERLDFAERLLSQREPLGALRKPEA